MSSTNNTNNFLMNKKENKKSSILFINYPKKKRLEYITCKKYDIEEIKFYEELNKYNLNFENNSDYQSDKF